MVNEKIIKVMGMIKTFSPEERRELLKEIRSSEEKEKNNWAFTKRTLRTIAGWLFMEPAVCFLVVIAVIETLWAFPISLFRSKPSWVLTPKVTRGCAKVVNYAFEFIES